MRGVELLRQGDEPYASGESVRTPGDVFTGLARVFVALVRRGPMLSFPRSAPADSWPTRTDCDFDIRRCVAVLSQRCASRVGTVGPQSFLHS